VGSANISGCSSWVGQETEQRPPLLAPSEGCQRTAERPSRISSPAEIQGLRAEPDRHSNSLAEPYASVVLLQFRQVKQLLARCAEVGDEFVYVLPVSVISPAVGRLISHCLEILERTLGVTP